MPIEKLSRFRPFVERIMPGVYDDSLTYYEMLSKVVAFLNQINDQANEIIDFVDSGMQNQDSSITSLQADVVAFKQDITSAFNLFKNDVTDSVVQSNLEAILDAWDTSGRLDTIIGGVVDAQLVAVNASITQLDVDKADLAYVDTQLATKATTAYVDGQLATKATTTYVNGELANKADTTTVNAELATKADITYVDAEIQSNISVPTWENVQDKPSDFYTHDVLKHDLVNDGITNNDIMGDALFATLQENDEVYFPEGVYYFNPASAGLVIPANGITLKGDGIDKTILVIDSPTNSCTGISAISLDRITVKDMTIKMGNYQAVTGWRTGLLFRGCTNSKAENVKVENWHTHGIRIEASSYCKINACEALNIVDPYVTGGDSTRKGLSVGLYGGIRSHHIGITNCKATGCKSNTRMNGIGVAESDNIFILGNMCDDNDYGINCQQCTNVTVMGNQVSNSVVIGIDSSHGGYGHQITGNTVYNSGNDGIRYWSSSPAEPGGNAVISNNICFNNGLTVNACAGIRLSDSDGATPVTNCVVIGNRCYDSRTGVQRTQAYGILCDIAGSSNFVNSNLCTNNVTKDELLNNTMAYVQHVVSTTENFLEQLDTDGTSKLFYVDYGGNVWANGHQKSIYFNNTTRLYFIQPIQAGDYLRISGSGITEIMKLYAGGGVTLGQATGGKTPDGTLNSKGVYVDGVQVIGAQQSAVANATQDLASLTTQLNALLGKLRTHGIIASS